MLSGILVASWLIIGPSAILAVFIILMLMPLQLKSAKIVARLNRLRRKETSSRVQAMTESVSSIKLVKMYVHHTLLLKPLVVVNGGGVAITY